MIDRNKIKQWLEEEGVKDEWLLMTKDGRNRDVQLSFVMELFVDDLYEHVFNTVTYHDYQREVKVAFENFMENDRQGFL